MSPKPRCERRCSSLTSFVDFLVLVADELRAYLEQQPKHARPLILKHASTGLKVDKKEKSLIFGGIR